MSYTPENYTAQLMLGIAKDLDTSGFAVLRMDDPYEPGERGIYFETHPALDTPTPIEAVTISPYQAGSGKMAIEVTRIQIRMRHVNRGKLEVRDRMDKLKGLFPDERVMVFGNHFIDRVNQTSATNWVDPDRQGITESSQNFNFRGNRYQP